MNPPSDDEITELTELDALKVSAVDTPANGTPWLLLKSAAPVDVHPQGETMPNPSKSAAKAAKKAVRQGIKARRAQFAQSQAVAAQKSAARSAATAAIAGRMARIQKLESALKSGLPDASAQDRACVQMDISLQKLAMAEELARFQMAPAREAAASQASTAAAQQNATGTPINARMGDAEAQLRSVFGGTYTSESPDRGQTELSSQHYGVAKPVPPADFGEIGAITSTLKTLKKQLAESRDPLELQRLGDQITLLQLTRAHMTGVA